MLTSTNDVVTRSSDIQDCGRGAYDGTAKKRRAERSSGDEGDTSRNKRRRTTLSESGNSGTGGDDYHDNGGDDGDCGDPTGDPESLGQGMECPICHISNYPDSDSLLYVPSLPPSIGADIANRCPLADGILWMHTGATAVLFAKRGLLTWAAGDTGSRTARSRISSSRIS